jgi:hypothetical protein
MKPQTKALLNAKRCFKKGNPQGVKEVISIMEWLADFYPHQTATPLWITGCRRT